jgi:WD40 repeat protein
VSQLVTIGRTAFAACADGGVVGWDRETTRLASGHGSTHLDATAHLYTGAAGRVLEWRVPVSPGDAPRVVFESGSVDAPIWGVKASPDGTYLAVSTGVVDLVDLASRETRRELHLQVQATAAPRGAPRWFGQHGTTMIAALDVATREVVLRLRGHRASDRVDVAGAVSGDRVVSVTSSGEAWLWDARLGAASGALPEHEGEVIAVTTHEGQVISVAIDGSVWTSRLDDGVVTGFERAPAELTVAATGGGAVLAGGTDGIARLWSGGAARLLPHGDAPISSVALGDVAVTGALDGTIAIWPLAGDAPPVRIAAGGDPVRALAVGADGITSRHRSGAVRVWSRRGDEVRAGTDAAEVAAAVIAEATSPDGAIRYTSHPDGTIVAHGAFTIPSAGLGAATALHATPDGRWLVAGYASGAVRAHPATLASARARACSVLGFFGRVPVSCRRAA